MKFARYITSRILQGILVIFLVIVMNFFIINLAPGDPVDVLAGELGSEEYIAELKAQYGLDKPITTRLVNYLTNLFKGDWGISYKFRSPVIDVVKSRIFNTLVLVLSSEIFAIFFGTWLGTILARNRGSVLDKSISNISLIIYCFPAFWIGMLFILFFAVKLHWFPSGGMISLRSKQPPIIDLLWHLVLPWLTIVLVRLPVYIKLARSSVIEVSQEDYMTTAKAIGYGKKISYKKYALRNALLPIVTQAGLGLSTVFSGALITETVFSWPGMGLMIFNGVQVRDYPLIMGGFLITSVMVVVGSFIVDLVYMYLDPRVVHNE